MAGAEPVYVTDFDAVPSDLLARTALAFFCNPSNPQGSVASAGKLDRLVTLAREHDFLLAADECYSEIYRRDPPPGILDSCARLGSGLKNVAAFHSLSKRSSTPGLRSGFVIAEEKVIAPLNRLRSYCSASMPLPVMAASAALWRDEAHVAENRELYNAKVDLADKLLGHLPGYRRPEAGFFLWLAVGDGEAFTKALWRRAGVKLLPGAYLARPDQDEYNPGTAYVRVAMVHDLAVTERALVAIRDLLSSVEAAAQ
jgi:N-succinyldiaminopimelate aminotransferase